MLAGLPHVVKSRLRFALATALALAVSTAPLSTQQAASMTAHFIDVGQGHATLLEFPCGTMLIDAGGEDQATAQRLRTYLKEFFDDHPSLDETLELVLITHNHIDHTRALPGLLTDGITIKRFIDNGWTRGSGAPQVNSLKAKASAHDIPTEVRSIKDSTITALSHRDGLTDSFIDPFDCGNVNPEIRILSGALDENPDWSEADFKDANNHSVVTRVDFGEASFLFLGDMETPASSTMMDYYDGTSTLDADVLQVSHHGARNGTSSALVRAVSPEIAMIPSGDNSDGKPGFTAFGHGHPNVDAVSLLTDGISRRRSEPVGVRLGVGRDKVTAQPVSISKAVYASGWDGHITIRAETDGSFTVRRSKP